MDGCRKARIEPQDAGLRLDSWLMRALSGHSRTAVQRLIEAGGVRVGGKRERNGYRLRPGDDLEWDDPSPPPMAAAAAPEAIPLDVLFEDAHLLVINKPRGLVVHPAPGHAAGTLVNAVLAHAGEDLTGIGGVERPGIVHRLDKDTSGLLVVAKTEPAFHSLQQQIAGRTAERRYVAVVRGTPRFERAVVDAPVGRHPTDRKRMAVLKPGGPHTSREAKTDLRVLERFPGFALLEARLNTGRTHQIRVHCAYIHLPVVGDDSYGPKHLARDPHLTPEVRRAVTDLGGQALHAYRLAFDHPETGERRQWIAHPPADYQALLQALGSRWEPREEDPWPD